MTEIVSVKELRAGMGKAGFADAQNSISGNGGKLGDGRFLDWMGLEVSLGTEGMA
jgi:hypothetical protein